jgi:hypothetical protein
VLPVSRSLPQRLLPSLLGSAGVKLAAPSTIDRPLLRIAFPLLPAASADLGRRPNAAGLVPVAALSSSATLYRLTAPSSPISSLSRLLADAASSDPRWNAARLLPSATRSRPQLESLAWMGSDRSMLPGDWIQLEWRFSDAVQFRPGQALRIDLGHGQLRQLQFLGGQGGRVLRFGYRVATGDSASAVRLDLSSVQQQLLPLLSPETTLASVLVEAQAATAPVQVIASGRDQLAQARVTFWQSLLLQGVAQDRFNPLATSRALALLNGALFDAANAAGGSPYLGYLIRDAVALSPAQLPALLDRVASAVLAELFAGSSFLARVQSAADQTLQGIDPQSEVFSFGQRVAGAFLEARSADLALAAAAASSYAMPAGVGQWRPTPPSAAPPLQPGWGALQPWLLPAVAQVLPGQRTPQSNTPIPLTPALTSAEYAQDLQEVQQLGSAISTSRSAEQTEIARFWANGSGTYTPPGHWQTIQSTVLQKQDLDLLSSLRVHALTSYALADAAIAAWSEKFAADVWRPITAIHLADSDGNPGTRADPAWAPLITTPPFPSMPSGHSTFSGAAATVLASLLGDQQAFSSTQQTDPMVVRHYSSLWDAAVESGRSRIYGGIHFEFDNTIGLSMGKAVAEWVVAQAAMPQAWLSDANDRYTSGEASLARAVHGGAGHDTLEAGLTSFSHQFWGDQGNDLLTGGGVADVLHGGSGSDTLRAGNAGARLIGSDGREQGEVDLLIGAAGLDVFVLSASNSHGVAYTDSGSFALIRNFQLGLDRFELSTEFSNYTLTAGGLDWQGASLQGAWLSAGQERLAFLDAVAGSQATADTLKVAFSVSSSLFV